MATEKTPTYSAAAVAAILSAIRANDNIADLTLAKTLVDGTEEDGDADRKGHADVRLDNDGNPRKARSITAKMSRMAETEGFTYKRKAPTTKSGQPVVKKLDAVKEIARLAGVDVAKLDGMEKAPKMALDTIRTALADMAEAA